MKKSRRNEIYRLVLNEFEEDLHTQVGLCGKISHYITNEEPDPYTDMRLYPEIYKRRPKNAQQREYWFDLGPGGHKKRIKILLQAIEETNPKKNGIRRTPKRASVSPSRKKSKGKRVVARVAGRKGTTKTR
jgi:hypothetical protein